jgi:hypothetical protein
MAGDHTAALGDVTRSFDGGNGFIGAPVQNSNGVDHSIDGVDQISKLVDGLIDDVSRMIGRVNQCIDGPAEPSCIIPRRGTDRG